MITIELKFFVTLSKYLPDNAAAYPVDQGKTVTDLIDELNIPIDDVKLIFVNGRKEGLDYAVKDGDRLGLFPPVGGG